MWKEFYINSSQYKSANIGNFVSVVLLEMNYTNQAKL